MRISKQVITIILFFSLANFAVNSLIPLVHATTYAEYPDLVYHLWNDLASSLNVVGTVFLYEHINFEGRSVSYTDMGVALWIDNFDNIASSLKINGIVKLFDEIGGGWRQIVFSSDPLPDDNWGTPWNENSYLVKNSGGWDSRTWEWGLYHLNIAAPDSSNYVDWIGDGLVKSKATDSISITWRATNFDQGYEIPVSDHSEQLPWSPRSLKVMGSVTLYDEPNYQGNSATFTDVDLTGGLGGMDGQAQSLVVDGTVNIWQGHNWEGSSLFFTVVSAQPDPLKVSDTSTIMLDGVVSNWWWNLFGPLSSAGIKFDVVLTENISDPEAVRLMMELYIVRFGLNVWPWHWLGSDRENWVSFGAPNIYNYRAALEMWSEYVTRIIYPGDNGNRTRWNINLKPLIQRACNIHGLNINDFYISKISFTQEADMIDTAPSISSDLHRLRLAYLGPSGGGCPFVSAWNGTQYVVDNNLLRDSARGNGTEVEDYYRLEQDLVPFYEGYSRSYYSLQISEFQQEHSYLDEVDFFAVDHDADVNVAVSPTGEILSYQNPHASITAIDENNASWLDELSEIDGEYYEGYNGSYVILNFGEVNSSDAKLLMRTDPPPDSPPIKRSIHVQGLNSSESWVDVVSIIPRTYWATDIIDLSDYLPSDGELVVRLYFTDNHRVDFVGLDTTPQAEIEVEDANLLLAYHSDEGFVTSELRIDDDIYAELVPSQQITLLFSAAKPDAEARTFIFYVKGYYYTITS